ncbi:hypothetical protein [Helicobacter pylori]
MQKADALEIKLCKIPMIRDTERNPNSRISLGKSQMSLVLLHYE